MILQPHVVDVEHVKRMALANALMDSTEFPVQVKLYIIWANFERVWQFRLHEFYEFFEYLEFSLDSKSKYLCFINFQFFETITLCRS